MVADPLASARGTRDGSTPGSERSPRIGNGNSLQYSCRESPMDRGAWWASVHRAKKSWARLSNGAYTYTQETRRRSSANLWQLSPEGRQALFFPGKSTRSVPKKPQTVFGQTQVGKGGGESNGHLTLKQSSGVSTSP